MSTLEPLAEVVPADREGDLLRAVSEVARASLTGLESDAVQEFGVGRRQLFRGIPNPREAQIQLGDLAGVRLQSILGRDLHKHRP